MIVDNKLMKYVVFKKRTEHEVRQKCKVLDYTEDYIDEIINYLKEANFLNDELYVRKYISNVKILKKSSVSEIKFDLIKRGIDEDYIEPYLNDELYEFEINSAIALANKKYKNGDDEDKIKRYLLGKGYSYKSVSKAIDSIEKEEI